MAEPIVENATTPVRRIALADRPAARDEHPAAQALTRREVEILELMAGGFDVFAGLPIAFALRGLGKEVHLANLSFTDLTEVPPATWLTPALAEVGPGTPGPDRYFPERTLARWLEINDLPSTVYALDRVGVAPLKKAYRALTERLSIDAVVLIDGGTDILLFGDESGLGTPEEDMASLAAVNSLQSLDRIVVSVGFGIDAFHGVDHTQVLENLATLERDGAYLGAFSISRHSPEGSLYLDAVTYAHDHSPLRPSIVNGSIAAAIRGEFANVQFTTRTNETELFINPLMTLCFAVDLPALARHCLYLERIERTLTNAEITGEIEHFRETLTRTRSRRSFPH